MKRRGHQERGSVNPVLWTLLLLILIGAASAVDNTKNETECHGAAHSQHYMVVALEWEEVHVPFGICVWIMIASLAILCFGCTCLPEVLPESCLLIIIGFAIGGIISIKPEAFPYSLSSGLDTDLFFLILLPPIMLEAGYFMPARSFFGNIGTILLYAVIGTLFNTIAIGISLYGISQLGWYDNGPSDTLRVSLLECLMFSSLISAVDPVAVLAVFEEIQVHEILYILVFGESLLNDAVTVVLYRMFESFNAIGADNLKAVDIVVGLATFFIVAIGGVVVGLLYGFVTSLLTRFTHKARVVEPIFVFAMAYLAYLTAEMFRLSAILAIIFCAIFMKPYVEANISQKSHTTIKYFLKMLSTISETIIFIFLGVTTLVDLKYRKWNTIFVTCSLVFCLLYRSLGVAVLTWIANTFRLARLRRTEQFIMAYGGLRGAITFSLVALLCKDTVSSKEVMFTTCVVVIMFTVFIQGTTIKPLVEKLEVKRASKRKPSMNEEIVQRLIDHLMVGIEKILGQYGHHHLRNKWDNFNRKFMEPILLQERRRIINPRILEVFGKLNEKDAKDYIKARGSFILPDDSSLLDMLQSQSSNRLSLTSQPSFSALPVSDGVPCLFTKPSGTSISKKSIQQSSSHDLDLLVANMYKPPRRTNRRKLCRVDSDVRESQLLNHRMKVQLRGIGHKLNQRRKSSFKLAVHYSISERDQRHLLRHEALSNKHPSLITRSEEDEDEGITFSARESFQPEYAQQATEHNIPTASQKTSPPETKNDTTFSVCVEMNPCQFAQETPPPPSSVIRAKATIPSPRCLTGESVPLTEAEELPEV